MQSWPATLAVALCACALPEGHRIPWPPDGAGGAAGQASVGGGGGSPESFENAIQWNSACAIASANDSTDLSFGADDFTIELWYQPLDLPALGLADGLLTKGGLYQRPGWTFYVYNDGASRLFFATSTDSTTPKVIYTDLTLTVGVRYHIVLWREGAHAEIWLLDTSIEGQTMHVLAAAETVDGSWMSDEPLVMGSAVTQPTPTCVPEATVQGVMDEVRIFASRRTPSEYDNQYAAPIPPQTSSLVAYWQMNASAENAMSDSAGNHDLTVSGALNSDYQWVPSPFATP
ncbi:MAG TPA: LamG-like jellyroll fold domain-containing protein [Polyangiaceae bacterium]|nr:LamG-like jellyroll fold domain-containing protein [Polyangiaceae bacterium]